MRTARSSSCPEGGGGLHQATPRTRPLQDQTPSGPGTPPDQAPFLWTESQTPVKTLPSRNFVWGR